MEEHDRDAHTTRIERDLIARLRPAFNRTGPDFSHVNKGKPNPVHSARIKAVWAQRRLRGFKTL